MGYERMRQMCALIIIMVFIAYLTIVHSVIDQSLREGSGWGVKCY